MSALVTIASALPAFAQEAAMMDVEMIDAESERLRDRAIYSPGESSSAKHTPVNSTSPKDSVINTSQTSGAQPSSIKNTAVQSAGQTQTKSKVEKPAAAKPEATQQKQTKNDDDSILSFNFLYYIIEKYKLQDIVD